MNLGGFLGAAVTQVPVGALLDSRWAGAMEEGARQRDAAAIDALVAGLEAYLARIEIKPDDGQ